MKTFYSLCRGIAPFALLWMWYLNMAPSIGIASYVALLVLFIGYGVVSYIDGVNAGLEIGRVALVQVFEDIKKESP